MITKRRFILTGLVGLGAVGAVALGKYRAAFLKLFQSSGGSESVSIDPKVPTPDMLALPLSAPIPRLLFFPECKPSLRSLESYCSEKNLRLIAIAVDKATGEKQGIRVFFSNGKDRSFTGTAKSYYQNRPGNRPVLQREGVLLKLLASFILDSLFGSLRSSRFGISRNAVRQDFFRLQEQEYLESMPIEALFSLVSEMSGKTTVGSITFDAEQLRFVVR